MRGVKFEVLWSDCDSVEYRVRCSNDFFAGETNIYANHDDLRMVAKALSGFPRDSADFRNIELGTMDPGSAGGGIQITFYCVDSAGHAAATVKLRADNCVRMGEAQSVCLLIPLSLDPSRSGCDRLVHRGGLFNRCLHKHGGLSGYSGSHENLSSQPVWKSCPPPQIS